MILTVCTLLSLLQHIMRFKLSLVKQRKLTLFLWGSTAKLLESVQMYG